MTRRILRKLTEDERKEMPAADVDLRAELPRLREIVQRDRRVLQVRVTPAIEEALEAFCRRSGSNLSDLLRDAALVKIGRKDLIGTMPGRGRPKS
jgi:hypothetical protein